MESERQHDADASRAAATREGAAGIDRAGARPADPASADAWRALLDAEVERGRREYVEGCARVTEALLRQNGWGHGACAAG